jgi:hypothetical protein
VKLAWAGPKNLRIQVTDGSECRDDSIEAGKHPAFASAKRRQSPWDERRLEAPKVPTPEGKILREIDSAWEKGASFDPRPPSGKRASRLQAHLIAQPPDGAQQLLRICFVHEARDLTLSLHFAIAH